MFSPTRILCVYLFLLALALPSLARPTFRPVPRNATQAALVAQRQTSRHEIARRAHATEVVQRVYASLQNEQDDAAYLLEEQVARSGAGAIGLGGGGGGDAKGLRGVGIGRVRDARTKAGRGRGSESRGSKEDAKAEGERRVNEKIEQQAKEIQKQQAAAAAAARETRRLVEARELGARLEAERMAMVGGMQVESVILPERKMYKRGDHPTCVSTGRRTGYARYPGWTIQGDELTGSIPVTPAYACVQACNKYGGLCAGVSFDAAHPDGGACRLQGTRTSSWVYTPAEESEHHVEVQLVGGCAMWSGLVPKAMNEACCDN